ncbi:MAG TPA: glutaredoxin 3 [Allosphingosinicella sp.]|jgi:glutaredoxin 3
MARVELYTKATCPYCARARKLLDDKGVDYDEYEISRDTEKRAEMIQRSKGVSTVPQIFIGGRHIGGSDDLAELERQGQLDPMLAS